MRRGALILLAAVGVTITAQAVADSGQAPAGPLMAAVARPADIADLVRLPLYSGSGDTAGPLRIVSASFGQRGLSLLLTVKTAGDWRFTDLAGGGSSICVDALDGPDSPFPIVRMCAAGSERRPQIKAVNYDAAGHPGAPVLISLTVDRGDRRTFVADIPPPAVGLAERSFFWRVATTWTASSGCSEQSPCVDRLPQSGAYPATTELLTAPRCFGAAARPSRGSCVNADLRLAVVPTPDIALMQGNSFCFPLGRTSILNPCRFRATPLDPAATIALLGDSHASHWRGGLSAVANARRWEGISITHSGCRYSTVVPMNKPPQQRRDCVTFRREARQWLTGNPQVDTVFISNHVGTFMKPATWRETVAGARKAIEQLPATLKHIYVIRDVPRDGTLTADCITSAMRARRPAGPACALRRKWALPPDPTAQAARETKRPGVVVLDLTQRFCSKTRCFPVVGGALVHSDTEHLTDTFSTTLGPVLLGRLDALRKRGL